MAEHRHVLRLVGGQQHRTALTGLGDQLPEPHALFGVESDGRLVEDEEAGVADERGGQRDPLPHAAGQLLDAPPPYVAQVDLVQDAPHLTVPGAAVGQLLQDRHVVDELEGREVRVVAGRLREIAEQAARLLPAARGSADPARAG